MVSEKEALKCVSKLIEFIGDDPRRSGLIDTPSRVVNSFKEIFSGYKERTDKITKFDNKWGSKEMIILRDIAFNSFCEHHWLPILGSIDLAYIPDKYIVGISKLPRIVSMVVHKLQIQENIGVEIGDLLQKHISPLGIAVRVNGKHLCMRVRGVKEQNTTMITHHFTGLCTEDKHQKKFFNLLK